MAFFLYRCKCSYRYSNFYDSWKINNYRKGNKGKKQINYNKKEAKKIRINKFTQSNIQRKVQYCDRTLIIFIFGTPTIFLSSVFIAVMMVSIFSSTLRLLKRLRNFGNLDNSGWIKRSLFFFRYFDKSKMMNDKVSLFLFNNVIVLSLFFPRKKMLKKK